MYPEFDMEENRQIERTLKFYFASLSGRFQHLCIFVKCSCALYSQRLLAVIRLWPPCWMEAVFSLLAKNTWYLRLQCSSALVSWWGGMRVELVSTLQKPTSLADWPQLPTISVIVLLMQLPCLAPLHGLFYIQHFDYLQSCCFWGTHHVWQLIAPFGKSL